MILSLHLIPLLDFDEVNRTGRNYSVFSWQVNLQLKRNFKTCSRGAKVSFKIPAL